MFEKIVKFDPVLSIAVFLLICFGLLSLYSISLSSDEAAMSIFARQFIFVVLGIFVMFFFSFTNYHYLRSYSTALYFLVIIFLLLVLLWGSTVRGTVGWIGIGAFHIQPVEIAKLALIIFLASFISQKRLEIGETGRLIASFVLVSIIIFLVLKQPDFGSAMVLASIWAGIMIISGISKKIFLAMLIMAIIIISVGWFFLADFQKARINSLMRPDFDPQGSGYNVIQSTIAIGSGGLTGKGIGHGSQSQLNFLPEKHNDFIFAVIAEELGLFGVVIVFILFFIIFYRLKIMASEAPDNFGYLLITGIMIMLFVQTIVNIGMNMGIVPVTGISLPFLSYGGSFLLTVFAALGIVFNIGSKRETLAISGESDYTD